MIPVPLNLMNEFQQYLNQKRINRPYQAHYQKWLRYYWDFCSKYHHPVMDPESLKPFIDKLRHKKQSDAQINQAVNAVSLYYEIVNKRTKTYPSPPSSSHQECCIREMTSKCIPPHSPKTLPPHIRTHPRLPNNPPIPREQKSAIQPALSESKRGPDNIEKQMRRPTTGASWEEGFSRLRDEIKVRHYSPKTLKINFHAKTTGFRH